MSAASDNLHGEPPQPVAACGSPRLTDAAGAPVAKPTSPAGTQDATATPTSLIGGSAAKRAGGANTQQQKKTNGGASNTPQPPKLDGDASKMPKPAVPNSLSHSQLHERVKNAPGDLVQGLIPEESVNVFVGDSGLGKTPLLAQMGVCMAAGIPFLGLETRRAVVLYADYENSEAGFALLLDKLTEHLALEAIPDTFRYLAQPDKNTLKAEMALWRALYPDLPMLVICDSLRGFDPTAETKNENAAKMIAELGKWADDYKCAFVLIHHLRKENFKEEPSPLRTTDVMEWLIASAGARSLVNQSMVRFGIDNEKLGGAELVIKGHYKLKGAIGPIFVGRVRDEDGEPIGYSRVSGLKLLDGDQQAVFAKLNDEFRFKDVVKASGKNPKIVTDWLRAWRCAQVVTLTGEHKQRRYQKVPAAASLAKVRAAREAKEKAPQTPSRKPVQQACEVDDPAKVGTVDPGKMVSDRADVG